MAYKTWSIGEVLTAADMNTMVRDQGVTICTSSTRPNGVVAGKFIYETDTGQVRVSNGANGWNLLTMSSPPAWEMQGGNGMAIASAPGSAGYVASTTVENTGLASFSRTPAQIGIALPGRYDLDFGIRFTTDGRAPLHTLEVRIEIVRGGKTYRNYTQQCINYGSRGTFATRVNTNARLNINDQIKAWVRQDAGYQLNVDDSIKECAFSGCWTGP